MSTQTNTTPNNPNQATPQQPGKDMDVKKDGASKEKAKDGSCGC